MMSANCSVVVTLSRVSRPCRTQCCSAKCLISTCFNRPGPNALPCQCTQTRLPSNKQSWCIPALLKIRKPTRAHTHKQLPSKIHFHHCATLLVSAFETNQPLTLLQASTNHKWSTSFFFEVCPRSITPANHFRQLLSDPNQFQMHVSRSAKLVSDVSCDPWSARNSPLPGTLPRNASRNGVS